MTKEELEYNRGYRYGYERGELNGYKLRKSEEKHCEDAVSRKDMYFKLTNGAYPNETTEQFINRLVKELEDMPPATPAQRWISVSERLPEENGFYLATCDGEICGENEPFTGLAEYENGKWVDDEEDYQCVLAWMPLPKPYKAEMEEAKAISLEKVRAEIEEQEKWLMQAGYNAYNVSIAFESIKRALGK